MRPALLIYGRWILLGTLAVCLSLVIAQELVSRRAYDESVRELGMVTHNSIPSLLHLAEIRRAIREAGTDLATMSGDDAEGQKRLASRWTTIDAHLEQFLEIPALPGEPALRAHLLAALDRLRDEESRLFSAPPGSRRRALLARELLADRREVHGVLDTLSGEDAKAASRAAQRVALAHARASTISLALISASAIAFLLAGGASWFLLGRMEVQVDRQLQELDAFAGRVAHDLKGPLYAALLSAAVLRRDPLAERSAAAVDHLEGSLRRASGLVDSLLLFARSGARPQPGTRADVDHVIGDLSPALQALAVEERATLSFEVVQGLEVAAAPAVVSSIVENLLRNALLYLGDSPRREVQLSARADGGQAVLEVTDTGPGIPADLLRRLFRPFERGSTRPGGSGLGLATVKRLVEAHGGTVEVRSQVGAGAAFTVRLPLAEPAAPGSKVGGQPAPGDATRGREQEPVSEADPSARASSDDELR